MADQLTQLETRIVALERVVFGQSTEQKESASKVIDRLVAINNGLTQTIGKNEKLREAMRQVAGMKQYLDPSFTDNLPELVKAKYDVIAVSAPIQEQRARQMEFLKSLEPVLDSEHVKNAPASAGKLARLSLKQAEQSDMVESHTTEVSDLFQTYSELVLALSKEAVYWDQALNAVEKPKADQ